MTEFDSPREKYGEGYGGESDVGGDSPPVDVAKWAYLPRETSPRRANRSPAPLLSGAAMQLTGYQPLRMPSGLPGSPVSRPGHELRESVLGEYLSPEVMNARYKRPAVDTSIPVAASPSNSRSSRGTPMSNARRTADRLHGGSTAASVARAAAPSDAALARRSSSRRRSGSPLVPMRSDAPRSRDAMTGTPRRGWKTALL